MKRSDRNNKETSCGITNKIDFNVVIDNLAVDESLEANRKPEVIEVKFLLLFWQCSV